MDFPLEYLTDESKVAESFVAEPSPAARRATESPPLDVSTSLASGEAAILAVRYPSGALEFHLPVESGRRGAAAAREARFVVTLRSIDVDSGRRGLVSQAVKGFIIKIAKGAIDKVAGFVIGKLVAACEANSWKKKGLKEGWLRVTHDSLAAGKLQPGLPATTERALLLVHGTFSNAAAAFRGLATSSFFDRVAPIYGDRIFAFDHFSLSRTPEENARMLLEALPNKTFEFDVITHSRGGLVLRNLVERAAALGAISSRFKVGKVVLVACPNDGTPLATPKRWEETVGWFANLLEMFPDNPFTTGAGFVANALVWLARHLSGDVPGLHSMDSNGSLIDELQAPPGPPPEAYSALVSNYSPTGGILQRLLDAGIDAFFGSANDLVVPTEGGWRVDRSGMAFVPATRIGCFGPSGNLTSNGIHHLNFFSQPESLEFIVRALTSQAQGLASLDPTRVLPNRRSFAANEPGSQGPAAMGLRTPTVQPASAPIRAVAIEPALPVRVSETFQLVVMPRSDLEKGNSQILAHYGSARVLEPFYLSGSENNAGTRWKEIFQASRAIKAYVDMGVGAMPSQAELRKLGEMLFDTLFPGAVRRLYDTARSLQRSDRLNVVLTSTIPWVADNPWEFAYDPVRRTSLATEDIHFVRNVLTAVPAEIIDDQTRLRILVASSQPIGAGKLSIDEEVAVIRRGFDALREAGLAEVEVLPRATPASLHGYVSTGKYSIVHFIGHGEYDPKEEKGYLVFQDEQGNPYRLDDRSVREVLCGRSIRLVFLNACETGQGGHADFNKGVAPALVAGGVPIVVANQYKVLDTSATFFAQHFYWSLAQGMAVGEAAREARVAVNYSLSGESIDWAVPVLYARDPDSRLSPSRPRDPRSMPSPVVRASSRRRVAQHAARVGVWDASSQFPTLRTILDRFSSSQTFFGFEQLDLSVPFDSWHYDGKKRFLDADRFAKRLAPQIAQLGVHYIAAIVDEWMVCDVESGKPTYYIYGWWSDEDQPPVLIFSSKGLGLEPKGADTERAIANLVASGLAGHILSRDSHRKGPQDCPNYYNPRRKREIITAPQKFCSDCSRDLAKENPVELAALNAILRRT